jgi:hypothetical protein
MRLDKRDSLRDCFSAAELRYAWVSERYGMLETIAEAGQDCWDDGWGLILFIVLPLSLLISTHCVYDSKLRIYSFRRFLFLALIPYSVIWFIIAMMMSALYASEFIAPVLKMLACFAFFPLGPGVGWVLLQTTLGYNESQASWAMARWSMANIALPGLALFIARLYY